MKKLKMLISILLISLTAFSETNTKNIIINKDTIGLPIPVARAVVKDLIKKDSIFSELTTAKGLIGLLNRNLTIKDSIISIQKNMLDISKQKEVNSNTIIVYKDQQLSNSHLVINALTKENKNLKVKNIFSMSIMGAIILFLSYLVIK